MSVPSQKSTAPAAKTPIGQVYCSADNLRAKFLTPSDNEPKQLVTDYARLALVSNDHVTLNDEDLNEITRFTLKKAVDKVQMHKELLGELRDIFHHHDKPCPRLILIMGGPGIGKTTLVNEICMKWAKRDGFLDDDFDLVILIPSRSVQKKSLEEAVMEHIGEETYEQMKKSAGARSLIILDGWDEIPAACLDKDPFLTHHMKDGGTFPEATVLITSRPHACLTLEADRKIELVGFSEKEIQEFVQRSFSNDANLVDEFMQQFKKHAALCTICYAPKTLEMIVDLFQYSHGKLPEFLTKLYLQVIKMLVNKSVATKDLAVPTAMSSRNGEEVLRSVLVDIPEEAVGPVLLLSKMAYRGFFDWKNKVKVDNKNKDKKNVTIVPKVIFTVEDLVQSGISNPAQFNGYGLLITCDQVTYSFAHVAIQDLLCALYVSTLSEQEQYHLMGEYFHYFPTVFAYLCGLTGLKSSVLFQLVFSLLTGRQCERCILTAIHCLYESQNCNMPQSALPFSLSLGFQSLQPYDCLCISHVLLFYPVDQLRLGMCFMGDKGVKMLTTVYSKEDTGSSIQLLHLWRNDLTANGMEYIMKIVKASNATLTEIMIGGDNRFGDDVMPVMCKGLQHLCKLATLNIRQVCLTKKGAYFIGEFLKTYCVLETLDLSQNNVGDDGILAIADALLCNQTLTELWVGDCGVTVKGVEHIKRALMVNTTLQKLSIHYNKIGDDGMSIISEAIKHNKTLTILWAWNCGFSVKGCVSMSEALKVNQTLETLGFSNNSLIGDDGLAAIAGVLGNCKLAAVDLQDCSITLTGAKFLATSLQTIKRKFAIFLDGNDITVEGVRLILQSAVENKAAIGVWVDDDYKDDQKVAEMLSVLEEKRGE